MKPRVRTVGASGDLLWASCGPLAVSLGCPEASGGPLSQRRRRRQYACMSTEQVPVEACRQDASSGTEHVPLGACRQYASSGTEQVPLEAGRQHA